MRLFRMFGMGETKILEKDHSVKGTVTAVRISRIYVVKKPVRLVVTPQNTIVSHFITFKYAVDNIPYNGKLFVSLNYRCPQKGEQIDVYYDPENPKNYAFYSFGPNVDPIGW